MVLEKFNLIKGVASDFKSFSNSLYLSDDDYQVYRCDDESHVNYNLVTVVYRLSVEDFFEFGYSYFDNLDDYYFNLSPKFMSDFDYDVSKVYPNSKVSSIEIKEIREELIEEAIDVLSDEDLI